MQARWRPRRWPATGLCAGSADAEGIPDAGRVGRIDLGEMAELAVDDVAWHAGHGGGDVLEQALALPVVEQAEQGAGLAIVVVAGAMIVAVGVAGDAQRRLAEFRRLTRSAS